MEDGRIGVYTLGDIYSKSKTGSYVSYIAKCDDTEQQYLLTEYNLDCLIREKSDLVANRILFIKQNFHLFHCKEIFFNVDLKSNSQIKMTNIPNFISKMYVVEAMNPSLVDCWYQSEEISHQVFKDIGLTLHELHKHGFCYGYLSPLMVVSDTGNWKLRVPPVNPLLDPRIGIAPSFAIARASFRTTDEIRFYFAPEHSSSLISPAWDAWAFGVLVYNFTVLNGGEVFASVSWRDQVRKMRQISGIPEDIVGFFSLESENRQTIEEWMDCF